MTPTVLIDQMQMADANGVRTLIGDLVQLAFSVGVAWYLLTVTTTALRELRDETRALNGSIQQAIEILSRDGQEVKRDIRALVEKASR